MKRGARIALLLGGVASLTGCLLSIGTMDTVIPVQGELLGDESTTCRLELIGLHSGKTVSAIDIRSGAFTRSFVFGTRQNDPRFGIDLVCDGQPRQRIAADVYSKPSHQSWQLGKISAESPSQ